MTETKIPPIIVKSEDAKETKIVLNLPKDTDHDLLVRLETRVQDISEDVKKLNSKVHRTTFMWITGGICTVLALIVTYLILFSADIHANKIILEQLLKAHKVISLPIDQR